MELYIAFAFLLIVSALLVLIQPTVKDIENLAHHLAGKQTLRKMANPKSNRIQAFIRNIMAMMTETGQAGKFTVLMIASLFLLVLGTATGIGIGNLFLSPVLAITFASFPFLYIRFQYQKYNKLILEELEVTLSTISLSYERTENILSAIEENLDSIQPPIKRVFAEFVDTVKYYNPNMETAIDDMKRKIDHSVFREWCEALKRCANNRTLKTTLRPIVGKLTKIKTVSGRKPSCINRFVSFGS